MHDMRSLFLCSLSNLDLVERIFQPQNGHLFTKVIILRLALPSLMCAVFSILIWLNARFLHIYILCSAGFSRV